MWQGVCTIGLLLLLTACESPYKYLDLRPWGMAEVPEGTPIFRKGWDEGCKSGMGVYGGKPYRDRYKLYQDPVLYNNDEYYRAWRDGFSYCRWYIWNWNRPWK